YSLRAQPGSRAAAIKLAAPATPARSARPLWTARMARHQSRLMVADLALPLGPPPAPSPRSRSVFRLEVALRRVDVLGLLRGVEHAPPPGALLHLGLRRRRDEVVGRAQLPAAAERLVERDHVEREVAADGRQPAILRDLRLLGGEDARVVRRPAAILDEGDVD